jgi:multiple sugar transport system ATP-binding protein
LQKRPQAEIQAKVREVAAMVGLTDLLHRKPGALSGGQRQRVAMARALAKDSAIFLFDEPLSNLDAKLRGQMRAELALMSQRVEKNMIYVTHDQIEAMTLADRIAVMHKGYIQQKGSPEELFKRPVNTFVAGFIGMPSMNFLDSELVEEDGRLFAKGQAFQIAVPEAEAQNLQGSSRKVILGIRPSDLIYDQNAANAVSFDLSVQVSEYIGAQSVLLCGCGDARVTVELKSETPIPLGQTLRFAVRPEGVHLFDRSTEKALLR